jgi:CheY-like chemotaxis protein
VITISDTGIGIEPQFLPYVFDRFRQADSTPTRRYAGLGLGLAIVRHVVEMHGGSVSASSRGKGRGATFTVRLPAISPTFQVPSLPREDSLHASEPEAHHADVSRRLGGVRALVVDDDPDTLEMLRFVLDDAGAEVIGVPSASEALRVLDHYKPTVLISDVAMPDEGGYELIAKIRSRSPELGGTVPALALSAYARPDDRARATAAGFQLHLSKPIDPMVLVNAVAELAAKFQPKV